MLKKHELVMLPTNEKASIVMNEKGKLQYFSTGEIKLTENHQQNLYILSDEEIKEGDYHIAINLINTHPFQCLAYTDKKQLDAIAEIGGAKKIIATTDRFLGWSSLGWDENSQTIGNHITKGNGCIYSPDLPQPSQSFIEVFIREHNKGNVITEVMVEYEEISNNKTNDFGKNQIYYQKLKINPNNTINIKPIKDSWSREEIEKFFSWMKDVGIYRDTNGCIEYKMPYNKTQGLSNIFNKWIKENL